MKKILIIHTGGTISMTEDRESGSVAPQETNPLHELSNSLNSIAQITSVDIFNLPSPHITPTEMLKIGKYIKQEMTKNQFDGVVITHGTDTLEETAYFLNLYLGTEKPIVVTGAMRSSNEIGSDGLYNLISSVKVASSDEALGKGVLVVLNDEIHSAINTTKTSTSNVATFQSPQYGPLGLVTKRGVLFHHAPLYRDQYDFESLTKNVVILKAYAGMDDTLLLALTSANIDGVVIEALGQGNLPPKTVNGIKELLSKNIPIVLVSRCFNGIVQDIYGYEGGGRKLKDMGVIFSNGLTGQKARLKLLVALELTSDHAKIQDMFL